MKVRSLTHGALTVALYGVMLAVFQMIFAGDISLGFLIPVLIIVYGVRFSTRDTMAVMMANAVISLIIPGNILTSILAILYQVVGLSYVYFYHKGKDKTVLYWAVFATTALIYIVSIVLAASVMGINMSEEIASMRQMLESVFSQTSGVSVSFSDELIRKLVIMTYLLSVFMESYVTNVLALIVMRYLKLKQPPAGKRNQPLPAWSSWLAMSGYLVYLLMLRLSLHVADDVFYLIYLISLIILVNGGIHLLRWLQRSKIVPWLWPLVMWLLLILLFSVPTWLPWLLHPLALVGFIDGVTDLRKRLVKGKQMQ